MIAYAGALRLARGERDGWDLVATSETALARASRVESAEHGAIVFSCPPVGRVR